MKQMIIAAIVLLLFTTGPVLAQTESSAADMNDTIEMIRSVAALERKAVITKGLQLSGAESQAFWPIYDEYVAEKKRVNDRLVRLITDYADNYQSMTDDFAKSMVDDHMRIQGDLLKVRKKYIRKFTKVLSDIKLARFYQLENKLDAVANVKLAQQIPLVTE